MRKKEKPSIAIMGIRGVPASYSGYETFAEELCVGLAEKGYDVTAYGRKGDVKCDGKYYKGVKLVVLPTIRHKYFDTLAHTFLSVLHVIFTPVKHVYICNTINSALAVIPRLFGKKVWINVDGLEWKRAKWNSLGKFGYRVSEKIATILANTVITDSRGIKKYYKEKFGRDTVYISYGANITEPVPPGDYMRELGLEKRKYILYVSRLEPDNNAHVLVKAYEKVKGDMPLIIVGDAPYATEYIKALKSTTDKRIKFLGYVFGNKCDELRSNAFAYVHGNEVGGTNPGLLQAMAFGNCVLVNGVNFNEEVIGEAGISFRYNDPGDLALKLESLMEDQSLADKFRAGAVERIKKEYSWEKIVLQYESLLTEGCRDKKISN